MGESGFESSNQRKLKGMKVVILCSNTKENNLFLNLKKIFVRSTELGSYAQPHTPEEGAWGKYVDRITDSMRRAIDETERRQRIQLAYNKKHGIKPASIVKDVRDLTDRVKRQAAPDQAEGVGLRHLPKKDMERLIRELERQMRAAADILEFEKAAMLRDQVVELRAVLADKEAEDEPAWERERRRARLDIDKASD